MGKQWKQWLTLSFWAPKSLQMVIAAMKLKDAYSLEESYDQPRQHIKKQRHYFVNKGSSSWGYGFSSSHVRMWELDRKEGWAPKNWCFRTVVQEKTLESPLDSKEIKPVNPKRHQPWISIWRTDAEAEAPKLWPPEVKSQLTGKDPDAGKDWRQEEKGTRGWDGWMASPIRWTWVWVSSGSWWWTGRPGTLQSSTPRTWGHCSPWGHKESDTTEQLNRTEPWCLLKLTSSFLKSEQSSPCFDLTSGKLPMSWSRWKLLPLECALGSRISHWPLPGSLAVFGIKASYIIHVPATFSLLSVISVISLLSELTDISPKRQVISSPNILRQFSMRNCMKEICNTKGQKMGYYFTYGVIVYHISSMNLGSNQKCKWNLRKIQTWLKNI